MGFSVSVIADIFKFPWPLFPKFKNPYQCGVRLTVPPEQGDLVYTFELPENNVYELHTLSFSASGYRDSDSFSLMLNNQYVLYRIYTKELGQAKDVKPIVKIDPKKDKLKFVFHNNSGTSKSVWIDLDFACRYVLVDATDGDLAEPEVKVPTPKPPQPPDNPDSPDNPGQPDNPDQPDTPDNPDTPAPEIKGKVHLLSIGNNDYDLSGGFTTGDLQGCINDMYRMQNIIGNFFNTSYEVGTIRLLNDQNRQQMMNAMKSIADECEPNDILVFSYSGHGDNYNGQSYLCPVMSETLADYITAKDMDDSLGSFTGKKFLFLDCCHSGGIINKSKQFAKGLEICNEEYGCNYNIEQEVQAFNLEMSSNIANGFVSPKGGSNQQVYLNTDSYHVITAAGSWQYSLDIGGSDLTSTYAGAFTVILENCIVRNTPLSVQCNSRGGITFNQLLDGLSAGYSKLNLWGTMAYQTSLPDPSFEVFMITDKNKDLDTAFPPN